MDKIDIEKILKDKENLRSLFKQKIEEEKNRGPELFVVLKEFKEELNLMQKERMSMTKQLSLIKDVFGKSMSPVTYKKVLDKLGIGIHNGYKNKK